MIWPKTFGPFQAHTITRKGDTGVVVGSLGFAPHPSGDVTRKITFFLFPNLFRLADERSHLDHNLEYLVNCMRV